MANPAGLRHHIVVMVTLLNCLAECAWDTPWSMWWSYEGISGPEYWGVLNHDWTMCKKGRQQSPIDIDPARLLFDPNLKHLQMEYALVKGQLRNTGHDISLLLQEDGYNHVNVSLGPLSYNYRLYELKFHFGNSDVVGSEHTIAGKRFPVEMHMLAYNTDLYQNFSEAVRGVKGITVIAVFMELGKEPNKAFTLIEKQLTRLQKKGTQTMVHNLKLDVMVPDTDQYMTYEGSLTQPGCQESVTWILFNKPVYISSQQLSLLRVLYGVRESFHDLPLETNARPLQPLNHRVVRTNINYRKRTRLCTMEREMHYQINDIYNKKERADTQRDGL